VSITINATPGDASANSLATELQFIAYLATRLNVPTGSTVEGTTCSENERKALIEATRELAQPAYVGDRVNTTQALPWPRAWAPNPDAPTTFFDLATQIPANGSVVVYFADDVIPQRMIDATCELAVQFLKAGTTDIAALDATTNVASKTTGPLSTSYVDPTLRAKGLGRFPRVMQFIGPLLDASRSGGLTMVRC
jgi:hypothetical protein